MPNSLIGRSKEEIDKFYEITKSAIEAVSYKSEVWVMDTPYILSMDDRKEYCISGLTKEEAFDFIFRKLGEK